MDSATTRREPTPDGKSPFLFLPLPMQIDIEESPTRRLLAHGPAGIAKSYGGRWMLYRFCLKHEGIQCLLLRCTIEQLRKNHLKFIDGEIRQIVGPVEDKVAAKEIKYTKQPDQVVNFEKMGSSITMGYCDNEGQIGQWKGPEFDIIVFEQAEEFIPEALEVIASRDRCSPTGAEAMTAWLGERRGRCVLLANAGGQSGQYLDDHYINRNPDPVEYPHYQADEYAAMEGDVEDNPYLEPGYREKTLGGLRSTFYAQLAENRRDVFEGQFFPDFHPGVHVTNIEPD